MLKIGEHFERTPQILQMPVHVDGQRFSRLDDVRDTRFSCFARIGSLLSDFVAEIHNFIHRMRFLTRVIRFEVAGVGSVVESDCHGNLQPNERLLACIRDMKTFSESHPWATDFDRMLFRKAWMAGAKWASDRKMTRLPYEDSSISKDLSV